MRGDILLVEAHYIFINNVVVLLVRDSLGGYMRVIDSLDSCTLSYILLSKEIPVESDSYSISESCYSKELSINSYRRLFTERDLVGLHSKCEYVRLFTTVKDEIIFVRSSGGVIRVSDSLQYFKCPLRVIKRHPSYSAIASLYCRVDGLMETVILGKSIQEVISEKIPKRFTEVVLGCNSLAN